VSAGGWTLADPGLPPLPNGRAETPRYSERSPEWLAAAVEPRLEPSGFSFDRLAHELEQLAPGSSTLAWEVLDRLDARWERLAWSVLAAEPLAR
jgi:hypothetical protein